MDEFESKGCVITKRNVPIEPFKKFHKLGLKTLLLPISLQFQFRCQTSP